MAFRDRQQASVANSASFHFGGPYQLRWLAGFLQRPSYFPKFPQASKPKYHQIRNL